MKEITLEDIANAINTNNKDDINEASLGRVYQHITKQKSDSFAIITAYRGGFSKKQNDSRNKSLEGDVRSLGLGFFKVKGYWVECSDSSLDYESCPADMKVPVVETSLFIPDISYKDAVRLGKKYDQDAIVFQGSETNDKVEVIDKNGSTLQKLGNFSPNKIKQAYTKVKGKSFAFEGFEFRPSGMLSNLAFEALLKKQ